MTYIISLETCLSDQQKYLQQAYAGDIFIYPTDTIYGIGGIVTPKVIEKIATAKQRLPNKHYSIIAPNFSWIQEHFDVSNSFEQERTNRENKFPGRGLTLLLPLRLLSKKSGDTNLSLLSPTSIIGVRYLGDYPFQQFVSNLKQPFITTSCNISGTQPIKAISDIPPTLQQYVDLVIDGGYLDHEASVVIDYLRSDIIRA